MSSNLTQRVKRYLPKALRHRVSLLKHRWRRSVSQFGQDFWVLGEVFNEKKNGFFIDIGAADGVIINNTLLLEKRYHWRGICIEANPVSYEQLVRVRNATCLCCCVDDKEGEVRFLDSGYLSGIIDEGTDVGEEMAKGGRIFKLRTRPLKSILEEHQAPRTIDYMSIDVEGAEERILGNFPFSEYCFRCLTLERPKPMLREILQKNGYVLTREIPGFDCFYLHESFIPEYRKNMMDFWAKYRL